MSSHLPPHTAPALAYYKANSNNGDLPSAALAKRIADGVNHLATYQKKLIFCRSQEFGILAAGAGGSINPWPLYWRTGENTAAVRVYMGIVDTAFAATDPYVRFAISTSAGAAVVTKDTHYNGRNAPAAYYNIPSAMAHKYVDLTGLSSNTEYYWIISVTDGARLAYATAVEMPATPHADDTADGCIDAGKMGSGHGILDATVQDMVAATKAHWRHSGQMLLVWNPDYNTAFTTTATTYTNVIDATSTTVTAATPGYSLPLGGHLTTSRTTVPVKIAVHANRTVGTGSLSVRVTDGTNYVEITGITTGGTGNWYTATGNLTVSANTKFDVWAKVSAGTFAVDSVCFFEYEA